MSRGETEKNGNSYENFFDRLDKQSLIRYNEVGCRGTLSKAGLTRNGEGLSALEDNGMEVIARKKGGIGFMYFLCMLLGVFVMVMGLRSELAELIYAAVIGGLLIVVCGYIWLCYLLQPKIVISYDGMGHLLLPHGKKLSVGSLTDVTFKCAEAKNITYKWGTVILTTASETRKCAYVANCEQVAERVRSMMEARRLTTFEE